MDSIDLSQVSHAVHGFLASLEQTGSDMGHSISNLGNSISSKFPSTFSEMLPMKAKPVPPPPKSFSQYISDFFCEHKRAVAFFVATIVTTAGVYYVVQARNSTTDTRARRRKQQRRLARRASNGGRSEVVLIAGSPKEPLVRLVSQDLNIRGYIVYITATSIEEEFFSKEDSEDIRPLRLPSYFDPGAINACMHQMSKVLETPVSSFAGAVPHYLSLAGVLIIPDLFYPSGPMETILPTQWAQTVQSKVQMPLNILAGGGLDLVRKHSSRVILVTPMIIGSLAPAFHVAESMVYGALSALALSLSRELAPQHIPFTHMRLGSFDTRQLKIPSPTPSEAPPSPPTGTSVGSNRQVRNKMQADILSWPDSMRRLYGGQYKASAFLLHNQTRGSNLRVLYHSIIDVLASPNPPRVVRVGRGSSVYDRLTSWAPEGLISLLLSANERG